MIKKRKLHRLDAFITFYFKPNGEFSATYYLGGGKTLISSEEMGKYDSAYTINLGHIFNLVDKLEKEEFNRKDVAEAINLPERLVKFYTDERLILPEIDPGKGRGKVRKYSKRNIFDFALIRQMVTLNIKIQKIREFLEDFRKPALGIMDRYTGGVFRQEEE